MEFLRSFLRLHFVKPVMASRSVDCSLRLIKHLMTELSKSSALVLLTVLIHN